MSKSGFVIALLLTLSPLVASAGTVSFEWPSRHSKVVCGGNNEAGDLKMRESTKDGLLVGEAVNDRILIFIDLSKPGRAHFAFAESLSDAEAAKRDAILAKLSADEQVFLNDVLAAHSSESFMGMTDGYVHFRSDSGTHHFSVSCQELAN